MLGWWWPSADDRAPPLARAAFVGGAVTLVALAVASNTQVWPRVAGRLGASVYWFAVFSAAACAFSAALCISRARSSRASRLLAGTLVLSTLYQLDVLCAYEPRSEPWLAMAYLAWPAIPLALAFWARAAFGVTAQLRRARVEPRSGWTSIARASRRLSRPRVRVLKITKPQAELAGVWLPAVTFAIAGLVPGFVYTSGDPPQGSPWQGWAFNPHWPYILLCVWAGLMLLVAAVGVEAAWRCRAAEIRPGILVLGRSARTATKLGLVVITLVFLAIWTGDWPEPLADIPIALLLLYYALHTVDADGYRGAAQAFSSIRRRWVWAAAWILISLGVATAGRDPFMRGELAVTMALLLPLAPTALRAVDGIPQEVAEAAHRFGRLRPRPAEALAAFLAGGAPPPDSHAMLDERIAITRELLAGLTLDELRLLVTGLPDDKGRVPSSERNPVNQIKLRRFVGSFPPLDEHDGFDSRLLRFVHLFYETIHEDETIRLSLARGSDQDGFSKLWVLTGYLKQYISTSKTADERQDERRAVNAYRVWLRRRPNLGSDGRPIYTWKSVKGSSEPIAELDVDELDERLDTLRGREVYDAAKKFRDRSLDKTIETVRTAWLKRLESLESRPPSDGRRSRRGRDKKRLDQALSARLRRAPDQLR